VLACGGALVKPTRFHVQTISADTVVGMLRVGLDKQPSISNEEMGVLLQQGADEGVFQATEHEIVSNVLDLAGTKLDLPALAEPALFVPETMTVMKTARALPPHRLAVALVVDEFGGVEGPVSMTDVVASIVGESPRAPGDEPSVVRTEDGLAGRWWTRDRCSRQPAREEASAHQCGASALQHTGRSCDLGTRPCSAHR
jgi:CBS domain containing-hemolysin-like protein